MFTSALYYPTDQKKTASRNYISSFFQPKLTINQPDDKYEQEADAMADKVMRMTGRSAENNMFFRPSNPPVQRACGYCEEKTVQSKRSNTEATAGYTGSLSGGRPLHESERSFFEPRMGHDFSNVRLHTDNAANQAAKQVNALAYTQGNNIVFGANRFSPESDDGKRLLAHELAHTIQQSSSHGATVQRKPDGDPIHDQLLDDYSGFSGRPRDAVTQHEPGYEKWLQLTAELQMLIDDATWPQIRKRVYPTESAAGIQRARDRNEGKLPDLTGLGSITSLNHFAYAFKTIQNQWTSLPTSAAKMKAIGQAANDELINADVPPFRIVNKEPMEFKGYFSSVDWRFAISEQLVKSTALTDNGAAEVANTALHESRHAEQRFLSARYSAGTKKLGATALAVEQNIPQSIAAIAVKNKFDSKTDAATKALGQQMYQADVTDRSANQRISNDDGWKEMAARRKEAQSALQLLKAGATPNDVAAAEAAKDALKSQIAVVEQKYALYRRIPYEADAHEVGDAAELAFKGWPDAAPAP